LDIQISKCHRQKFVRFQKKLGHVSEKFQTVNTNFRILVKQDVHDGRVSGLLSVVLP